MSGGGVLDVGLQAERTALAWRRTALALAVAALVTARLAAPALGPAAVALGAVGLALAGLVAWTAARRYRQVRGSLAERDDLSAVPLGGLPLAALACSGALVAVLALVYALVGAETVDLSP